MVLCSTWWGVRGWVRHPPRPQETVCSVRITRWPLKRRATENLWRKLPWGLETESALCGVIESDCALPAVIMVTSLAASRECSFRVGSWMHIRSPILHFPFLETVIPYFSKGPWRHSPKSQIQSLMILLLRGRSCPHSKRDLTCFLHEDVSYRDSESWGQKVEIGLRAYFVWPIQSKPSCLNLN